MYLSRIKLTHFRSHHQAEFEFSPDFTIISGQNGSGKTNILEAIYVLATGSSFRDSDEYLTEYNQNWWKVEGIVDSSAREIRYRSGNKEIRVGDTVLRRTTPKSRLPVVLFEPDNLYMVHGSPVGRRRYIDALISSVTPGYTTTLRRYERIISQRNSLLRAPHIDTDTLFVLDIMLAEQAEKIITARQEVIEAWNNQLHQYYSHIAASDTHINTVYHCNVPLGNYKQSFITILKQHYDHDRLTGTTSAGPHRDDIEWRIDGKSFVNTASRGEVRSLVLALARYTAGVVGDYNLRSPVVLLDDVFSELDATRQSTLLSVMAEYQLIVTSSSSKMTTNNPNIYLQ